MKHHVVAVAMLTFAIATVAAQATEKTGPDDPEYTAAQVRHLIHSAHTAQQFSDLADYYAARKRTFELKAKDALDLWAQRAAMINPLSEKWPRPVDSARNLYQYYAYEAAHCGQLSAKYGALADAAAAK